MTTLDSDVTNIKEKLSVYERTTMMKEDQNKFGKAVTQLQQADDLTELTMLALKVTEELARAKVISQRTN